MILAAILAGGRGFDTRPATAVNQARPQVDLRAFHYAGLPGGMRGYRGQRRSSFLPGRCAWRALFPLLGNVTAVTGPRGGPKSFRRDSMTGFIAESVDAVVDTLECAIDLEEFVFDQQQAGPQSIKLAP